MRKASWWSPRSRAMVQVRTLHAIPVAGTFIGAAFVQRAPGRFDSIELSPGEIGETGPALVLPLRAMDTVAGVLVALRTAGAQPFTAGNST